MINYSAFYEGDRLERLADEVLSEDEGERFNILTRSLHRLLFFSPTCRDRTLSDKTNILEQRRVVDSDWPALWNDAVIFDQEDPEDLGEWLEIQGKINERVKIELCSNRQWSVLGVRFEQLTDGNFSRVIDELTSRILCSGKYHVISSWISPDRSTGFDYPERGAKRDHIMELRRGTGYHDCLVMFDRFVNRDVLSIGNATPATEAQRSGGRPRDPNLAAAVTEALERHDRGEGLKKQLAAEAAAKYGVKVDRVLDEMKPSRRRRRAKG